jgi:hypothetical protein
VTAELVVHMRATWRAQMAAMEARKKAESLEEYKTWHSASDKTDTTGVMRVVRFICGMPLCSRIELMCAQ